MSKDVDEFGINGNNIEQIYGYYVLTVGGTPNLMPSVREDTTGIETNVYKVNSSQGTMDLKSAHSAFTQVDVGATHTGGDFTIYCANKLSADVGAGGITLNTNGNTNLFAGGGIANIGATSQILLHSRVISINATEAIELRGPIHIGNSMKGEDEQGTNTLTGNVAIGHNLHVAGGAYINGELYVSHITCQRQPMVTEIAGDQSGFISPYQTFIPFQGKSIVTPTLDAWSPINQVWRAFNKILPNSPGLIDIVLALPFPAPIDNILTVPARIGFPCGMSLISDGLALQQPTLMSQVIQQSIDKATQPLTGLDSIIGDFFGPPHSHEFAGLPVTLVDSIDEMWDQAKSVDGASRSQAKAVQYNGMTEAEFIKKSAQMAIKQTIDPYKEQLKNQLKRRFGLSSAESS